MYIGHFVSPVPQVIILGPPASGKKSISKLCANKLRTAHLTTENLIQESETDIKMKVMDLIKKKEVHYKWILQ